MNFRKLINTLDHLETKPTTVLHEVDQSRNVIGMIQRYLKRGYIPSIKVDGVNTSEMSAVILTYRTLLLKNAAAILGKYSGVMPNIITQAQARAKDPQYSQEIAKIRKQLLANARSSQQPASGKLPDPSTVPDSLPDNIRKAIPADPIKSALTAIGTTALERLGRAYPNPKRDQIAWVAGKKYIYKGQGNGDTWVEVLVRPGLFKNNQEYTKVQTKYTTPGV